jgi:glyoxylase-like metal-dependent hydrolase (beta-lactamase superfamily II)
VPHEPLRIGGAEVVPLCDARVPFPVADQFPVELEEGWGPYREAYPWAFVGENAWDYHVHAFVLRIGGSVVLIDTGIGAGAPEDWGPVEGALVSELALADVAPGEVDHVVFTHLHLDHVGGATTREGEPRFPYATYHAHPADWDDFLEAEDPDDRAAFERSIRPVADRDRLEVEGRDHDVVPGVRLLHAPGHTRGHRAVLLSSEGEDLLITGDALHHPFQVAHPEWPSTHDADPASGVVTRGRLLRHAGEDGLAACVPHFAEPFGRVQDRRWTSAG